MRIETERLILRLMQLSDLQDSFEHRSDPEVCRFVGKPLTKEETKEKVLQAMEPWSGEENHKLFLAIELKSEKKLIGELMFKLTNIDSGIGEIGYRLNKNYQGKGLAFEANSYFIRHLFNTLSLHKICALCLADNEASWALMEKLSMTKEGTLSSHFKVGEKWHDAYLYSALQTIKTK